MNRLLVLLSLAPALAAAAARDAPGVHVIPAPKRITLEPGEFEFDEYAAIVVSDLATRGTRIAARAVQLGLREQFGVDVPILRISEERKHGPRKDIWIVEPRTIRPPDEPPKGKEPMGAEPEPRGPAPAGFASDELTAPPRPAPAKGGKKPEEEERMLHSPARTIGVRGLAFTDEMVIEGYFIRVDAIAVVIHGASDAGSFWGAQTLLQLVRPARKGGFLRKGRGPTIPCLWMADWPSNRERVVPPAIPVPAEPDAAERFLRTAARYKLNGIARGAVPDDAATRERLQFAAQYAPVPCIEKSPAIPGASPLLALALEAAAEGRTHLALAAFGEAAWGPPDPTPEAFRQLFPAEAPAPPSEATPPAAK
ncbi:MAG TPA: glycoside hydrolase family 20 zincin-like fold domain-containing protein [Planctomycetota bacterium]|nr:glycoside hydrolase family 20 zincin-like fold domain-containing protein [Planctomycetota bacterium]HRR79243.1 glycoside hydrolase family 20 zincin-like fold domain-containing protein [Planctomycetota bacterium]HRT96332.1 glycoside hydrolase family 20 zincin-like fold domain-containing protein [Planctomycetota bacterium]